MSADRVAGLKTIAAFMVAAGVLAGAGVFALGESWPWRPAPVVGAKVADLLTIRTADTLRRGETLSELFVRQGLPGFSLSPASAAGLFDPRRLRPGLVFTFERLGDDPVPARVVRTHRPRTAGGADPRGRRLDRVRRAGGLVQRADQRRGTHHHLAVRGAGRHAGGHAARRRRTASGWPGTWPTSSPGRWISAGTSARATASGCWPSGSPRRRETFDSAGCSPATSSSVESPTRPTASRPRTVPAASTTRKAARCAAPSCWRRWPFAASLRGSIGPGSTRCWAFVRRHEGTDYAADPGTPVMAAGDGVVVRRDWIGGYGNLVELRHANGIVTRYGHLKSFAKGMSTGDRVQQGAGDRIRRLDWPRDRAAPPLRVPRQRRLPRSPRSTDMGSGDPVPAGQVARTSPSSGTGSPPFSVPVTRSSPAPPPSPPFSRAAARRSDGAPSGAAPRGSLSRH